MTCRRSLGVLACLLTAAAPLPATRKVIVQPVAAGPATRPFVSIEAPAIVLRHVRLIDGTGAPAQDDRTIVIAAGRIAAVGGAGLAAPPGARELDLTGRTVVPGIVGMHDHLFYISRPNLDGAAKAEPPLLVPQMSFSAPRLYLAAGVTTIRTTGSVEPYTDLNLKRLVDAGTIPGPRMDVTGPYLEGAGSRFVQMNQLSGPEDSRRFIRYWAGQGVTSIKAYITIHRDELAAAIDEAHKLGLKVTGHLCSVTYPEAIAMGIDNLEHGFFPDTSHDPGKQPDRCPPSAGAPTLQGRNADGPEAGALIAELVRRKVALTSTLPVFEQLTPDRPLPSDAALQAMSPQARADFMIQRAVRDRADPAAKAAAVARFRTGMALERRFVAAGGLLMAGPDPTGNGGVMPGFGDERGIELLVEAGFTPEAAIRIATLNGAIYLGLADRIGSVEPGKLADLVIVRGDAARTISALRDVEIVFKDGVGYDPAKLRASAAGRFGQY